MAMQYEPLPLTKFVMGIRKIAAQEFLFSMLGGVILDHLSVQTQVNSNEKLVVTKAWSLYAKKPDLRQI